MENYYTFDWPKHRDIIRNEHLHTRNHTSIFNQSSFGKFILQGPDALSALEMLSTNNMDKGIGHTTYTLMCNPSGGIETDITISHIDNNKFYLVIGGGFIQYGYQ